MKHWLIKSEPETYSFDQFRKDKTTAWTGVRNFTARNFLKDMAKGDQVFFYHSGATKDVVGLGSVIKTAYPDPTVTAEEKSGWLCVDLKAGAPLPRPVTLLEIKSRAAFKEMALVRLSRLSVGPVSVKEAAALRKLGGL